MIEPLIVCLFSENNSYDQDEDDSSQPDEEPEVEDVKLDPLLLEVDPSKRLIMLIQELCDKLSNEWPGPDCPGYTTQEEDDSIYELVVSHPLEDKMDEDILNQMLKKTVINCTYCRQVKLIRIDKRQLAIHLFSKHLWSVKVISTAEESSLSIDNSDSVVEQGVAVVKREPLEVTEEKETKEKLHVICPDPISSSDSRNNNSPLTAEETGGSSSVPNPNEKVEGAVLGSTDLPSPSSPTLTKTADPALAASLPDPDKPDQVDSVSFSMNSSVEQQQRNEEEEDRKELLLGEKMDVDEDEVNTTIASSSSSSASLSLPIGKGDDDLSQSKVCFIK